MQNKGQVLIFTFFFVFMVMFMAGNLAQIWESELQVPSLQEHSVQAFYLSQTGIERAKIILLNDVTVTGDSGWLNDVDSAFGAANPLTFRYKYDIVNPGGAERWITGKGEVLDVNAAMLAHREIRVKIDGITDTNSDNKDDSSSDNVIVDWTWEEI